MADEPLHEIQLNGKQLVFLFMSATVVAVVIFLAGVMVGRGVRGTEAALEAATQSPLADPTALTPASTDSQSADAGAATTNDDLSYTERLESERAIPEELKPVTEPVASAPIPPTPAAAPREESRASAPRVRAETSPPQPVPAAARASGEPAGTGFVVQVAATRERGEADRIAQRLVGKGYPAFVTTPASGPQMFRVRVGKYKERSEATRIAAQLERNESFKPWITR